MNESDIVREHNARYAHLTNDEAWREYLGDDYDNEEALQERGDAAQATRYYNCRF